jgi:DNA-binding CsgD family transcriptional regulator
VTRYLQAVDTARDRRAHGEDPVAVLVGTGPRARTVVGLLESHGWPARMAATGDGFGEPIPDGAFLVFIERGLVAAARELKAIGAGFQPPTAIVICDSIRPGEVRVALSSGVAGIVLASTLVSSLAPTVAAALSGQVAVPRFEARQVEAASLSTREKQILGMVVMGCMNGDIAERLVVAESTVKSHLSSAFGKLGVRSRNEAVDLLLDSELGLGKGILGLGGEPLEVGGEGFGGGEGAS